MEPSDFIGFFISLLAIGFLYLRKRNEAKRRREHPELYREEEQQEDALKDFLKSMDMPVPEPKKPPVRIVDPIKPKIKRPKPLPTPKVHQSTYKDHYTDPYAEQKNDSTYEIIRNDQTSLVQEYMARLKSKKEMVILQEIMNPPKGLQ